MLNLKICPASVKEFATAIDWAAAEGWNPGLDDLEVFHQTDPNGFLMGWLDGQPVSSISVVKYNIHFGFLGFYIVHPDFRGSGLGLATWKAGMAHLKGCTIGLDGVVDQLENYQRSGFVLTGRNVRFTGLPKIRPVENDRVLVRNVTRDDFALIAEFDRKYFGFERTAFLRGWLMDCDTRNSCLAVSDDKICGFGTVRTCETGAKIGPLFAQDAGIAQQVLMALLAHIPDKTKVSLDVPADNQEGILLAGSIGLLPGFETARMYHGPKPDLPVSKIFGVTTFELG